MPTKLADINEEVDALEEIVKQRKASVTTINSELAKLGKEMTKERDSHTRMKNEKETI